MSRTPCWKRIQRLEGEGLIERRVALLNPEKLGLKITALVSIETRDHSASWIAGFASRISAMPEVLEIYHMAGDVDDILRVIVPDMQAYDPFYKRLIETVPLKNVITRFAMERVKSTTSLPLEILPDAHQQGSAKSAAREVGGV